MNHKTKHILVLSPLYLPHIGGLESHAAQWNQQMAARGYTITVWTPLITSETAFNDITGQNIHILRFPAFEIIPNYPVPKIWHPQFWYQWQSIRRSSPHISISRTRFFLTSIMAFVVAKQLRIPWMHIEHGSDFVHLHNPLLRLTAKIYDYTLGAFVLRSADMVIANSKASAAFVKKLARRRAEAVIHRGIDAKTIAAVRPVARPDVPTIIYVGRLIDGKGVHDLIAALGKLRNRHWQSWIIGKGPQQKNLQRQAQVVGINNRVIFLGELSWKRTIAYMKASTVLVNPSYTEGLPTTVIEAALAGTAVIATNVGGTREIIEHNKSGLLVPPADTAALAQALTNLLTDKQMRLKLANTAQISTKHRFDWEQAAQTYDGQIQTMTAI